MKRKSACLLLVVAVVLGGMYAALLPARNASAVTHRLELTVGASTAARLQLRLGDRAVLVVHSATPGEVMVHGLTEQETPVGPEHAASLTVEAAAVGHFPIHFHDPRGQHVSLGELDVLAR
ncbi:hypothetical protein VSR68_39735 [Paraburkholderia phymatum]|uniref:hypothetical protein n=1 Tax=Paraburkholderia TaxID=1822464 RepID=UPI0031805884